MLTARTSLLVLSVLGAASAYGCSPTSGRENVGTTRAALHRAKDCGGLLQDLKADALSKLNSAVDLQIASIQQCIASYGDANCSSYGYSYGGGGPQRTGGFDSNGAEAAPTSGSSASPAPAGSSSGASGTSSSGSSSGGAGKAADYSETNTQVSGVDEADIVKTDGTNLYVLHGNAFKVVKAWPATDLAELSTLTVEGQPTEMFVADGKAVIYSQVNGIGIYNAAGVTPKATYQDYGYGGGPNVGVSDSVAPGYPGGSPGITYAPLTKITVLTLNGAAAQVARELYFEGSYLSARRVGAHVRTVLQGQAHGPKLKYSLYEDVYDSSGSSYPKTGTESIAQLNQLRAENVNRINASQLSDWIPNSFSKAGATVTASTVACQDFYVPTAGSTESGFTEIASIDLTNPGAAPKETAILGRTDTIYGNEGNLVLAARAWVESPMIAFSGSSSGSSSGGAPDVAISEPSRGESAPPAPAPTPASPGSNVGTRTLKLNTSPIAIDESTAIAYAMSKTHLHTFDFATDPTFPSYQASATVDGEIKNQFSLDEKDGVLRVATTERRVYVTPQGDWVSPSPFGQPQVRPATVSHVFTLSQSGANLSVIGKTPELAPGEQIYSVRFVGNRGYVVTFRQVDPLFVIDLSAPATPVVLAALKIPGFSTYMHPLDENHLLTIGRDASDTGRAEGLQLQIFDVTNGAAPVLKHKFTYTGSEYGHSEAESEHKAFTFFAERGLLAFPYYAYGQSGMRSSLELFSVSTASGFSKVGSVDHTPLFSKAQQGYCGGYYSPQVRRGVFLEDWVMSISYGGIVAKQVSNLGGPGAQLPLSAPVVNSGYGPSCGAGSFGE